MEKANRGTDAVSQGFERAAPHYDEAASVQMQVARHLVEEARHASSTPATILDVGCGTGFVAQAAARHWPQAEITAVDSASSMLHEARRKVPDMRLVAGDISTLEFGPSFDLILSSMTLHWLPDPHAALKHWLRWLKPKGRLHVALLAEGSFKEWADLCASEGAPNGLWPMPPANFVDDLAARAEKRTLSIVYPSAAEFLHRLKTLGTGTPREGHRPMSVSIMRRLLAKAPRPFKANYEVLYIEAP